MEKQKYFVDVLRFEMALFIYINFVSKLFVSSSIITTQAKIILKNALCINKLLIFGDS